MIAAVSSAGVSFIGPLQIFYQAPPRPSKSHNRSQPPPFINAYETGDKAQAGITRWIN